jgi:addiction module HigA family antidote
MEDPFERLRTLKERPPHPGEYIEQALIPNFRMTVEVLAQRLGLSQEQLEEIIKGQAPITPRMAIGLSRIDKSDPLLWMDIQAFYDLWHEYNGASV